LDAHAIEEVLLNCPRCVSRGAANPYRGERPATSVALASTPHAAGVTVERCTSCRGTFAEYEALVAIENAARREKRWPSSREGVARRAYDPPTEAILCSSCSGETVRREWSIGTLVFVDVCIECRGVWLDGGELEILGG
jgi:Zn-finger nucleic acid-binding protein